MIPIFFFSITKYGTVPDYLAKIINHFRSYSRIFWSTDYPILFLILVVRDCTRYLHKNRGRKVYVSNLKVCCIITYFQIFDVNTVPDSSACLFCIQKKMWCSNPSECYFSTTWKYSVQDSGSILFQSPRVYYKYQRNIFRLGCTWNRYLESSSLVY